MSGEKIGRFVVVRKLGAGGMGAVYEARDPELSRSVAVKVLRDRGGDAMRLLREAQALARISHPNVVSVFELGSHDGQVFVAMELVDGVTLDAYLEGGARDWREILTLFVAAGRGLAAVHAQGLLHRDVKPSNILVDGQGRVRIGDFGLARQDDGDGDSSAGRRTPREISDAQGATTVDQRSPDAGVATADTATPDGLLASPLTETGAVIGTPRYMAPEQHAGLRVTRAADQFAFCIALWEALYGEHPFGASRELVAAVVAGRRRPAPGGRGVPAWLERAVARGLAHDPLNRWPSIDALVDELEHRPRRRRRVAFAGAMLGAIGAAVAGGVLIAGKGGRVSCDDAAYAADRAWSTDARAKVTGGLAATKLSWAPAVADRTVTGIDAWIRRWRDVRVDACRAADERGAESAEMLDRRAACLDQQLEQLDALVGALSHADAQAVARAIDTVDALPAPEECTAARVSGAEEPDAKTRAVDALVAAARTAVDLHAADLDAEVARAVAAADALARPAERARAHAIHADAIAGADAPRAMAELDDAITVAATAHDPVLEAEIAIQAVKVSGDNDAADRTAALLTAARAAVARAGSPRGLVLELASAEYAALARIGHVDQARAACDRVVELSSSADAPLQKTTCACELALAARKDEEALEPCKQRVADLRTKLGDVHPKVADATYNLVVSLLDTNHLDDASTTARGLIALYDRLYGAGSRDAARTLRLVGIIEDRQGKSAESLADLERALAQFDKVAPPDDPSRAAFLMEVAELEAAAGKLDEAVAHADAGLDAARRRVSPDSPNLSVAYVTHAKVLRKDPTQHERALDSFAKALAIAEKHPDQKLFLGNVLAFYASTLNQFGRYADALPLATRAVPLYEASGKKADAADTETEVGDALEGLHRRADARAAYLDARARMAATGDANHGHLAVVDAWLKAHPAK